MRKDTEETTQAQQPNFGAFITMIVGLLLFFGMVSRIGKVADEAGMLSITQEDKNARAIRNLKEDRQKAVALIGGRSDDSACSAVNTVTNQPVAIPDSVKRTVRDEVSTPPAPVRREQPSQPRRRQRRAQPQKKFYTVKPGDTLYKISNSVYGDGNKWKTITNANPGVSPSRLRVGQQLLIPNIGERVSSTTTSARGAM